MSGSAWDWAVLAGLGAYHGANPGMGWLFSVALAMQEKTSRAVWRSLLPIALGHALAIGGVLLIAGLLAAAIPFNYVRTAAGAVLIAFGALRLFRHGHPRGFGLTVGFRDLTLWSLLMGTAHGAGLMLLPVLFHMSGSAHAMSHVHSAAMTHMALLATLVHTASYLLVTGVIAFLVYEKFGLALLRKAWFNLDLLWAGALVVSGAVVLVMPS
jgi:hypothetical protein